MKKILITLSCGLLLACGGGGGGGTDVTAPAPATTPAPVTSTLSFPLRQAINTSTANGESFTLTAVGTSTTQATDGLCSGTYTFTASAATTATTFQGQSALSSDSAVTTAFTNCTPASGANSGVNYYDTNYVPLGDVDSLSGTMGLWQAAPNVPTTVRVNDVFIGGTKNYFFSTTGTLRNGHSDMTFVIEADTSTTAIINQILKSYNASGQLIRTSQGRTRIDAAGTLTRVSLDIQYATTSTTHLVFRR